MNASFIVVVSLTTPVKSQSDQMNLELELEFIENMITRTNPTR